VLKKVIDLREAAGQGPSNVETAKLTLALADVYISARRQSDLEECLGKVINGGKGTPLAATIVYAQALEKLAGSMSGSPREQELLREALKIRESIPGAEDFALVSSLEKLGDSLKATKSAEAADLYKRAIQALDKAMVSKDSNRRISYGVYSTSVNRMHQKLSQLGFGQQQAGKREPSAHW
jgi:hypothetical protein